MSEPDTTRAVPYLCPFCGEEDLRPLPPGDHADPGHRPQDRTPRWHCRACLRVFSVSFYGLQRPPAPPTFADTPTTTPATTTPRTNES